MSAFQSSAAPVRTEAQLQGIQTWSGADTVRIRRETAHRIRQLLKERRSRANFLPGDLFAEPAWDVLLDLSAARLEARSISMSSLCIAAGVPPTTAFRCIGTLIERELLVWRRDHSDKRRRLIELSSDGWSAMAGYLVQIGILAAQDIHALSDLAPLAPAA